MTESYRVLFVNTDRTWRGGERQLVLLIDELLRMGHHTTLATPAGSDILRRLNQDCDTLDVPCRNDIDLVSVVRLARAVTRLKPDLIHANSSRAHSIAALALVLSRHDIPLIVSRRVDFPLSRAPLNRWKYSRVDYYIPISRRISAILDEIGVHENRKEIVYESVDPEGFAQADGRRIDREFGIQSDELVVGNIGICEKRKGQVHIVQAAPAILERFPQTRFVIVGDGPERSDLIKLAKSLGVHERMIFPGFRSDVADFLAAFDVFVMPSLLEGLGSSILDAQSFGLPVVGTNVGGIPDIVLPQQTGLLVPVGDTQGLSTAILTLLKSPELRLQLGGAARKRILEHFTSRIMAEKTVAIYHRVLERKKHARRSSSEH